MALKHSQMRSHCTSGDHTPPYMAIVDHTQTLKCSAHFVLNSSQLSSLVPSSYPMTPIPYPFPLHPYSVPSAPPQLVEYALVFAPFLVSTDLRLTIQVLLIHPQIHHHPSSLMLQWVLPMLELFPPPIPSVPQCSPSHPPLYRDPFLC